MEEGVYLLKIRLQNIRCFGDEAVLDLADGNNKWNQWNVILGNNGVGKTTLLRSIALLEQTERNSQNNTLEYVPNIKLKDDDIFDLSRDNDSCSIFAITNLTALQDYDIGFVSHDGMSWANPQNDSRYGTLKIYGYGANRFTINTGLSGSPSDHSATLFDDKANLINAEEWLLQLDYISSKDSDIKDSAKIKMQVVKDLLLALLPDVEEIRFRNPSLDFFMENLKPAVEFKTPFGWVGIRQLSLGYKTVINWTVDLAARLFYKNLETNTPLAEPAIVLVDEIDLHMHPKWQRKIFDYLSEKFPKTQFIVTAHSPLIVQSAPKDANIVLLRREGDHVVIDNDIQSVHNWRIDQILNSDLFGNISQLPEEEEAWMEERTKLIQRGKLNEMEQQRLDELNKKAEELPTADNQRDIEAMQIIREAAEYLKSKKTGTPA